MPIQQKVWKIGAFVGLMLGLYLIVLIIGELKTVGYIGVNPNQTNTISVNGTGDAYAIPDVATFSFTVTDTEKAVVDAQTKATAKVNAALAVVRAAGVADKDISTNSYSINPHYEYQTAVCPTPVYNGGSNGVMIPSIAPTPTYCPPSKNVLTGYDVSESVSVKLRDLTKAGALLTALGSAGVDNLNGPSFDVDNPDAVQADARAKAIVDAQAKAQLLAGQLGVRLGAITSFSENNSGYPRPIMYAMDSAVGAKSVPAAAPEVPAGQQKVTDAVSITYQIQ
jgi:uncharacterized protein YggE